MSRSSHGSKYGSGDSNISKASVRSRSNATPRGHGKKSRKHRKEHETVQPDSAASPSKLEYRNYKMNKAGLNMHFSREEFKKIENIRLITKGNTKELGEILNEGKGNIPIFGYPLICYSPN